MSDIRYRFDVHGNAVRAPRCLDETLDAERARYLNERTNYVMGLRKELPRHPLDPPEKAQQKPRGGGARHGYKFGERGKL